MLLILKPLVMTMWRSRAFKELIVAMLEKIVTRTDNDLEHHHSETFYGLQNHPYESLLFSLMLFF